MLVLITNTCRMGCPHCMERSSPEPQHMEWGLIEKCCEFGRRHGVSAVMISGGEVTCHPQWAEAVRLFASRYLIVIVPTNGMWLGTADEDTFVKILKDCPNVSLQITSIPGLYPQYDQIAAAVPAFARRLRSEGLGDRMAFESSRALLDSKMLAMGRACEHEEFVRLAETSEVTASCFTSALIAAQVPFDEAILTMEMRGRFCRPMIDYRGLMHWSEVILCPGFARIDEPDAEIVRKAHEWRPCGSCPGFRKLLAKHEPQYVNARRILGL